MMLFPHRSKINNTRTGSQLLKIFMIILLHILSAWTFHGKRNRNRRC